MALTQDQIDDLVRGGYLNADTAARFSPETQDEPRVLETLNRDSDSATPPEPTANVSPPGNQLGTPQVDLSDPLGVNSLLDLRRYAKPAAPPPPPVAPKDNVGAAFGAPPNRQDLEPQQAPGLPQQSVDLRKITAPGAKTIVQALDDQRDNNVDKGHVFERAADNPSLRGGKDDDPATQKSMDTDESMAHPAILAFGHAQAGNQSSIKDYLSKVQELWDGYQRKPLDAQIDIVNQQAALDKGLADDLYKGTQLANATIDQARLNDAVARQKDQAEQQGRIDEISRLNKEVMDTKIEPWKVWTTMSGPKQFLVGLAGLFKAAATGRGDLIQNMVDKEANAQMEALDRKSKGVDRMRVIAKDYQDVLKDKDATRLAVTNALIDSMQNGVKAIGLKYGSEQAQLKADAIISDLQKKKDDGYVQLWNFLNPDPRLKARGMGVGLPKGLDYKSDHAVTLPDGTVFYANSPKEAEDLRGSAAAIATLDEKVANVQKLANDSKAYIDGRLEAAQQDLIITAKKSSGGGMNSDKDAEMLAKMVGAGSGITYGAKQILGLNNGANQAASLARMHFNNAVRSSNGTVVQTQVIIDPATGIPKRVAIPTGQTTGNYGGKTNSKSGAAPKGK